MKYVYEFIGTFFLILTIGMVVLGGLGLLAPLAIGSALMVLVFAGGHISGGHYNPAVSLAVYMSKKLSLNDLWKYCLVQFAGGIAAAMLIFYLKDGAPSHPLEIHPLKAFIVEFLFTFALCYVVLNVALAKSAAGNSYFGLAIGFTVFVSACAIGSTSCGALNPAVALSLTVLNLSSWSDIWIYFVANFAGGAVASLIFNAAYSEQSLNNKVEAKEVTVGI